ncbi:Stk1 family PASTA domain-containing Ser/Thr kinase [Solicola sp. PLA-1-18]|uniref:Stk1 family PASTA domain-containing Ser/Thr kinase n=1 Tax=Solicola sp. PLA-1-18 TaxID=3380532 RepID=UPI003B76083D
MTEFPGGPTGGEHSAATGAGRLGDRYELGGLLGRGGMADVSVGRDLRLGRTVAIKRLRTDLASDPTFLARFRREAQSAAALNHPSIVAVYDTGEATGPDDQGLPYIVMEYVEGQTLREVMQDGRKIMPQRSLEITADILSALDYSHRAGIVHRDIKPGNVMLTPAGQVKVMDFGIARAIADSSSAMTQTAAVVGTAQYLSPEQARGEQVDARSDIYSTGCLLFELLTGRPPFVGDSPVSVAYQHVREEPPIPSSLNPELTRQMDTIVAKALAKRTDDRYQSAAEMRTDIERAVAGLEVSATTASPAMMFGSGDQATQVAAGAAVPPVVTSTVSREPEPEGRKSRRGLWIALVLALLVLVAVGAWAIPNLVNDDPPPTPTTTVPSFEGLDQAAAERLITSENLTRGDVTQAASDSVEEGDVISSDPEAGTTVDEQTPVSLVISSGPETVEVPNVTGRQASAARQQLEAAGLQVAEEVQRQDDNAPRNQVLFTDPAAGSTVEVGETVTLTVSNGQVEVPDVVGMSLDDATAALEAANLQVRRTPDDPDAEQEAGQVSAQSPEAGDQVNPRSTVSLTVSSKPAPAPTPTQPTTDPVPSVPVAPEGE